MSVVLATDLWRIAQHLRIKVQNAESAKDISDSICFTMYRDDYEIS